MRKRSILNLALSALLFFNILTVSACAKSTETPASSLVDDVKEISDIMDSYGSAIVILSLFIVLICAVFTIFIVILKNSNATILEQQKKLLDAVLEGKVKPVKDVPNNPKAIPNSTTVYTPYNSVHTEKNLVEIFVKLNETIQGSIDELKDVCEADRVSVYVFHNGSYSSHGLPFFKFTCINEKIKKYSGMVPKIPIHTALPLAMYGEYIIDLYRHGVIMIDDVEAVRDKSAVLYGELTEQGVKSAMANAIYDANNNILGIVVLEFTKETSIEVLEILKSIVIDTIEQLAPVLSFADYQDCPKHITKGDR